MDAAAPVAQHSSIATNGQPHLVGPEEAVARSADLADLVLMAQPSVAEQLVPALTVLTPKAQSFSHLAR